MITLEIIFVLADIIGVCLWWKFYWHAKHKWLRENLYEKYTPGSVAQTYAQAARAEYAKTHSDVVPFDIEWVERYPSYFGTVASRWPHVTDPRFETYRPEV